MITRHIAQCIGGPYDGMELTLENTEPPWRLSLTDIRFSERSFIDEVAWHGRYELGDGFVRVGDQWIEWVEWVSDDERDPINEVRYLYRWTKENA